MTNTNEIEEITTIAGDSAVIMTLDCLYFTGFDADGDDRWSRDPVPAIRFGTYRHAGEVADELHRFGHNQHQGLKIDLLSSVLGEKEFNRVRSKSK